MKTADNVQFSAISMKHKLSFIKKAFKVKKEDLSQDDELSTESDVGIPNLTLATQEATKQIVSETRAPLISRFPQGITLQREEHIRLLCKIISRCGTGLQSTDSHRSWVCIRILFLYPFIDPLSSSFGY